MIGRALIVLLTLVGPAYGQSLTELYLESERARLTTLKEQAKVLAQRGLDTDEELNRFADLRREIRRVEGRIKALQEPPTRPE
jgi:hypothetical protein